MSWSDTNIKNENMFRPDQGVSTVEQESARQKEELNHIGNYELDNFRTVKVYKKVGNVVVLDKDGRLPTKTEFVTHRKDLAARIGQEFKVIDRLLSYFTPVYRIRFPDGVEVDAWPSEVCVPIYRTRLTKV